MLLNDSHELIYVPECLVQEIDDIIKNSRLSQTLLKRKSKGLISENVVKDLTSMLSQRQ